MKMTTQEGEFREQIRVLQDKNQLLEARLAEHERMQLSHSGNVESMRLSLNTLQELLTKCRVDLLQTQHKGRPESMPQQQPPPMSSTKSEIDHLKALLEVYKNDFAEERLARQLLLAEKAQLAEELQQLRQQNRALTVEALNNGHGGQAEQLDSVYSRRSSRLSLGSVLGGEGAILEHPSAEAVAEEEASHCRHCDRVFGDIYSLETHIDECPAY